MAKDGTLRGGRRPGQRGRPSKSTFEKFENGNPGGRRLQIIDVPNNLDGAELEGSDMPKVEDYLTAQQKDGKPFLAKEIFLQTWKWLKQFKCEKLVNKRIIEQFAMSTARWIQCEEAISIYGFLGRHPISKGPIQSPYVSMASNFMKESNFAWFQIYQIVKENCTVDFRGPNPQDDVMETLLRKREGK